MKPPLCIVTNPEDMNDGLFGNVLYTVFQVLPYLYAERLFPAWRICASQYGNPPDFVTVPGVLDLAYQTPSGPYHTIAISDLRRQQGRVLGNDWDQLSAMWHTYFKIPLRVLAQADRALPAGRGLGIHYRGNDKLTTLDDSNPFTQQDFLALVQEFLATRSGFDYFFAATDEFSFVNKLRAMTTLPVVNLGEVGFHKAMHQTTPRSEKTDRALLDSILLSRCHCVIETSSALPSFAKIFNPKLKIYRTAASKLFQDVPYFPVAFIPVLPVESPTGKAILQSSMAGDWTFDARMNRYKKRFTSIRRKPFRQAVLRLSYALGADKLIRKIVDLRNQQIRARLRRNPPY